MSTFQDRTPANAEKAQDVIYMINVQQMAPKSVPCPVIRVDVRFLLKQELIQLTN